MITRLGRPHTSTVLPALVCCGGDPLGVHSIIWPFKLWGRPIVSFFSHQRGAQPHERRLINLHIIIIKPILILRQHVIEIIIIIELLNGLIL